MSLDIQYTGHSNDVTARKEKAEVISRNLRALNLPVPDEIIEIIHEDSTGINIDNAIVKEGECVFINLEDLPSQVQVLRIHFSR